jgi:hypothetical protein
VRKVTIAAGRPHSWRNASPSRARPVSGGRALVRDDPSAMKNGRSWVDALYASE